MDHKQLLNHVSSLLQEWRPLAASETAHATVATVQIVESLTRAAKELLPDDPILSGLPEIEKRQDGRPHEMRASELVSRLTILSTALSRHVYPE